MGNGNTPIIEFFVNHDLQFFILDIPNSVILLAHHQNYIDIIYIDDDTSFNASIL